MSNIINIFLLVVLPIIAFIIFRRMRYGNKTRVAVKNPRFQVSYESNKVVKQDEISLTFKERVELSWQFLTNIAEQVLKRFSKQDKEIISEAGKKMSNHGMVYQHNVQQESENVIEVVRSRVKEKNSSKGYSR